jgi:hypothetical protein
MKKLITFFAVAVLVSGCSGKRTHDIADVRKAETITLKKASGQKTIHALSVTGSGEIDGNAEIALILNGGPYKTESLSGSVDFQWGGDWYSDQAEIRYAPASVTGGTLRLEYEFNN